MSFYFNQFSLTSFDIKHDTIFGMNEENYQQYKNSESYSKGKYNVIYKNERWFAPAPSPLINNDTLQQEETNSQDVSQNVAKDHEIKYSKNLDETKEQIVTIAPLRISNVNNDNLEETLTRVEKPFIDKVKEIAKYMGIEINSRLNIGGFKSLEGVYKGEHVNEVSYSFNLGNVSKEDADLFASLMGDLGLEVQEAVISMYFALGTLNDLKFFEKNVIKT